jgi:hypothetical protein
VVCQYRPGCADRIFVGDVANGPEIELQVTGAAGKTVEWTVDVTVVSS